MSPTALDLLRALDAATAAAGAPPPAALIGDWWDCDAVIAPSIDLQSGCTPPDRPSAFWFGYLGFPVRGAESALPAAVGGLTDGILCGRDGGWEWVSVAGHPCPDWVRAIVDGPVPPAASDRRRQPWSARWLAPDEDRHTAAVRNCLTAIGAGEVYQACICTRFTGTLTGYPLDYFADIAAATAPTKSAFLRGDWGALASFSPETFLRRTGAAVSSSPIKGTLPIDADPAQLAASVKDVAENVMIVDLVRNDLGRVAEIGSVTVPELLSVVPAPGVWHLVSTVRAELAESVGNDALLAATFPPASVTGTPKIRAAELIADWEQYPRGVYCGAIGMAGPDGLDLNVAIRTVAIDPAGAMSLGVGGGITADSDPHHEWQECLHKASSIITRTESPETSAL